MKQNNHFYASCINKIIMNNIIECNEKYSIFSVRASDDDDECARGVHHEDRVSFKFSWIGKQKHNKIIRAHTQHTHICWCDYGRLRGTTVNVKMWDSFCCCCCSSHSFISLISILFLFLSLIFLYIFFYICIFSDKFVFFLFVCVHEFCCVLANASCAYIKNKNYAVQSSCWLDWMSM